MPERQLTIQQKRYLKFAHLFFAALWGGGATTMVLLFCLFHPSTAHEQITFSKILFYIDFIIVGPGAGGCLATGLIYSLYGNWGFFKFKWITLKYLSISCSLRMVCSFSYRLHTVNTATTYHNRQRP